MSKKRGESQDVAPDLEEVFELYRQQVENLRAEVVELGSVIGFLDRVIREVKQEVDAKGLLLTTNIDLQAAIILVDKLCEEPEPDELD